MNKGEIIIYTMQDGTSNLEVKLEGDTVWLSQAQMVSLFGRDRTVITKHINNVFKEKELEEKSNVHFLHITNSDRPVAFYSLDVIISVGYRVKSKGGTQFRIWANKVLKEYLIKGYSVNEKIKNNQLLELKQTIKIMSEVLKTKKLTTEEAEGMLKILADYSYGLEVLDGYDLETLSISKTTSKDSFQITYDNAIKEIAALKKKFKHSSLFGHEKDHSFKSSVATIFKHSAVKNCTPA